MRSLLAGRRAVTVLGAIIGAIALSGCLSLETRFDIGTDGTADLGITMLIDVEQISEFAEMFGEDPDEIDDLSGEELIEEFGEGENPCDDLGDDFGGEIEARDVSEGGRRGISCTVRDVPLADLSDFDADDGSSFTITQDDDGTEVEIVFPSEDLTQDSDELGAMLDLTFEELFDIRFVVSAPGSLEEHNATSTDGSTATWQLAPDAGFVEGGDAVMTARWSGFSPATGGGAGGDDDGLSTALIIAIVAGVVVVVIAVALILRSRSTRSTGSSTPPPSEPPPPSGAAPPQPPGSAPLPPPPGAAPPPSS